MTLFDPGRPLPPAVQANQPDTARAAALDNVNYRRSMRGRILKAWFDAGDYRGYTDQELTELLDAAFPVQRPHHYPSVGKRRGELVELGWVEMWIQQDRPLTRLTYRGSLAQVWRLTRAAREKGYPFADPEER